jgi:hypothetical protein
MVINALEIPISTIIPQKPGWELNHSESCSALVAGLLANFILYSK